jgi:hypothetical protein
MIENYKEAREHGHSRELSVRWSIAAAECVWHSHPVPPLEPTLKNGKLRAWAGGNRIDTSIERFLMILSNTCRGNVTLDELDKDCIPAGILYRHIKAAQPKFYLRAVKAADNYIRIFGDKKIPHRDNLEFCFCEDPYVRETWMKYKRGKDFFILWKFDLQTVLQQVNDLAIVPPDYIVALGYGTSNGILTPSRWYWKSKEKRMEINRLLEYIWRYRDWFRVENRMGRLDEITRLRDEEFDQVLALPPERLFATIEAIDAANHERWGQPWVPMVPKEYAYDWLDKFPTVEVGETTIGPVRTYGELVEIGVALHNCAAGYHDPIDKRTSVLLVLRNGGGKPIALGQIEVRGGAIVQLSGACNSPVSKEVRDMFSDYFLGGKIK